MGGTVAPGYEAVRNVFAGFFPDDAPGASFAAVVAGKPVVELWGGVADDRGRAWERDTIALVFSGTKGVVATAVLALVERGVLDLDAPIAERWPAFAAHGKGAITLRQVLDHTAGLPGLAQVIDEGVVRDADAIDAMLAAAEPIVPIGEPSYHALTFGWLLDAIARRSDGRSVATLVRDEVVEPLGLDFRIGTADADLPRVARLCRAPDYALGALDGNDDPDPRIAWVYCLFGAADWNSAFMLQSEVPGGGGVGRAASLARLYGCLARGGELDGIRILRPETIASACVAQGVGPDAISGIPLRFGLGFELHGVPSPLGDEPDAFGHTGAGGSSHGAWPGLQTGWSLVISELRTLSRDTRARELLAALATCVRGAGASAPDQR